MLDPITADELANPASGIPNAVAFEFREGFNPFTKEPFRIRAPGVVVGEQVTLRLSDGRCVPTTCRSRCPQGYKRWRRN